MATIIYGIGFEFENGQQYLDDDDDRSNRSDKSDRSTRPKSPFSYFLMEKGSKKSVIELTKMWKELDETKKNEYKIKFNEVENIPDLDRDLYGLDTLVKNHYKKLIKLGVDVFWTTCFHKKGTRCVIGIKLGETEPEADTLKEFFHMKKLMEAAHFMDDNRDAIMKELSDVWSGAINDGYATIYEIPFYCSECDDGESESGDDGESESGNDGESESGDDDDGESESGEESE